MQKEKGEDIIKFKKYILESFDQLIEQLQAEQVVYFNSEVKFSMDVLHPGLEVDALSKSDLREFLVKHGIKVGDIVLRWSTEFKREVVSSYMVLVLSKVIQALEELRACILQRLDFNSLEKLKEFLEDQLEYYHKIINSHDGLLYVDPEYRSRTNRLLKNRFDVIWFLNEQYSIFPLEKRPNDDMVSMDADYPFISFNIDQWSNFETPYRVIPLLKNCLSLNLDFTKVKKGTTRILLNEEPLEEYHSEIFSCAEAEELFRVVLLELSGLDKDGYAIKRGFQPLCEAFFSLFKKDRSIIKRNATMIMFIPYLREKYQAHIKSDKKLSDGSALRSEINKILSDNSLYQNLKVK